MKKLLDWIGKDTVRIFFLMLPSMIIGWCIFPVAAVTYAQWITMCVLLMIWFDIMEIRNKLNGK